MKYPQDIRHTGQRMRLLQAHLEEQLQYFVSEKEVRHLLNTKHEQQRSRLKPTKDQNRLEWACLITRQANEVTKLACLINEDRQAMLARQKGEELELEQQIN